MTDQLWSDERIDTFVIKSSYSDLPFGIDTHAVRYELQMMRDEYEQALTNHKAIIVKQAECIAELQAQVAELEANLAKWRVIVAEVTVDRS